MSPRNEAPLLRPPRRQLHTPTNPPNLPPLETPETRIASPDFRGPAGAAPPRPSPPPPPRPAHSSSVPFVPAFPPPLPPLFSIRPLAPHAAALSSYFHPPPPPPPPESHTTPPRTSAGTIEQGKGRRTTDEHRRRESEERRRAWRPGGPPASACLGPSLSFPPPPPPFKTPLAAPPLLMRARPPVNTRLPPAWLVAPKQPWVRAREPFFAPERSPPFFLLRSASPSASAPHTHTPSHLFRILRAPYFGTPAMITVLPVWRSRKKNHTSTTAHTRTRARTQNAPRRARVFTCRRIFWIDGEDNKTSEEEKIHCLV